MKRAIFVVTLLTLTLAVSVVHAQQANYRKHLQEILDADIKTWLQDPAIIDSINAQNAKHGDRLKVAI